MNIVDITIIILILFGGVIGWKRGLLKELVSLVGILFCVLLAFLLKSKLAVILCKILPFFTFKGSLAGITVLNIMVYEIIAFLILLSIFISLLQIVIMASNIIDKIIKMTFIFTIPSKIGGLILGLIENYILVFIILYILTLPTFNLSIIKDSSLKQKILKNTPVLNNYADDIVEVGNEFIELKDKYKEEENKEKINLETLDILLKYNITTVESIDKLIESDKIKINNVESVLKNYRD